MSFSSFMSLFICPYTQLDSKSINILTWIALLEVFFWGSFINDVQHSEMRSKNFMKLGLVSRATTQGTPTLSYPTLGYPKKTEPFIFENIIHKWGPTSILRSKAPQKFNFQLTSLMNDPSNNFTFLSTMLHAAHIRIHIIYRYWFFDELTPWSDCLLPIYLLHVQWELFIKQFTDETHNSCYW